MNIQNRWVFIIYLTLFFLIFYFFVGTPSDTSVRDYFSFYSQKLVLAVSGGGVAYGIQRIESGLGSCKGNAPPALLAPHLFSKEVKCCVMVRIYPTKINDSLNWSFDYLKESIFLIFHSLR